MLIAESSTRATRQNQGVGKRSGCNARKALARHSADEDQFLD